MTKITHTHKLKRLKYHSGNTIFFCTLPDCNFKINISLVLGKRSICWRCGQSFVMGEYSLRLSKPHCDACHKPKNNKHDILDGHYEKGEPMSLAQRLEQTIHQAQKEQEDEI